MRKFLIFTTLVAAVALQACSDDPDSPGGGDEIDFPVPEERVNDVVSTTMDAKTCVMASGLDDMGALFVKRLQNAATEFNDETELLVLDDAACSTFVGDAEQYELLDDYYRRGGHHLPPQTGHGGRQPHGETAVRHVAR